MNNPVMRIDPSGHWPGWLDKAANTVKKSVNTVKNWVNDKVVKPTVNTVKSAASWANEKIVQPMANMMKVASTPIKNSIIASAPSAVEVLKWAAEKAKPGVEYIQSTVPYRLAETYIKNRTEKIKQKVWIDWRHIR